VPTRLACLLALSLVLAACDVVTSQYPTLRDAREDRLFERGWLPDVLPASARSIRTSNNADLNTSIGEFYFEAGEFPALEMRLHPYAPIDIPYRDLNRRVQKHLRNGYKLLQHQDEDSIWVFACQPKIGRCDYTLWINH
jgi:hypothetical protein